MSNYFVLDSKGNKHGPFDIPQLQTLVAKGNVGRQTPMESDTGHKGTAGQISGLFTDSSPNSKKEPQVVPVPLVKQTEQEETDADTVEQESQATVVKDLHKTLEEDYGFVVVWTLWFLLIIGIIVGSIFGYSAIRATFFPARQVVQNLTNVDNSGEQSIDYQLTDKEQASADKFIAEHGKDALLRYLQDESKKFREKLQKNLQTRIEEAGSLPKDRKAMRGLWNRIAEEIREDENLILQHIKYFVGKGSDVNANDNKTGKTPLGLAVSSSGVTTAMPFGNGAIKFLVSQGADVNAKIGSGWLSRGGPILWSPLHAVAKSGDLDVVTFLISEGADIQAKSDSGETLLHAAAQSGNLDVVKFFVSKGLDVRVKDDNGETLLHESAQTGDIDVVKYLVSNGLNVNVKDDSNNVPLHWAANSGNIELVKFLVSQGADIHVRNDRDQTPLHWAVNSSSASVVRYLVSQGADVNAKNNSGRTPLHGAAVTAARIDIGSFPDNIEIIKFLVARGADVDAKDTNGKRPIDLAAQTEELKNILRATERSDMPPNPPVRPSQPTLVVPVTAQFIELKGHTGAVASASFSADGKRIITSSSDNTARIWDANSGLELRKLEGHTNNSNAEFSPDGKKVITRSVIRSGGRMEVICRVWDTDSGQQLYEWAVYDCIFSPSGKNVITADNGIIRIYNVDSGKELRKLELEGQFRGFSPDEKRIVTSIFTDRTTRIWDAESGKELHRLAGLQIGNFAPNGKKIITSSADGTTIQMWDVDSGKALRQLEGRIGIFSPDGKKLATSLRNGPLRIWDIDSEKELLQLEGQESGIFSPDGRKILTFLGNNIAGILDANSGQLLRTIEGPFFSVGVHSFSPDGKRIVTPGNTARVWTLEP